jgi:hypothetical protein
MADKHAQRLAAERAAMARPKGPAPARDTYDLSRQRQREANAVGGVEGDQSVDETLAGAGQALSRTQGRADALAGIDAAAERELLPTEDISTLEKIGRIADVASLPLLATPAAPLAAAYGLARQGYQAYEDPSKVNLAMAGLNLLPGGKAAVTLARKGRGAAGAVGDVLQGADASMDVLKRQGRGLQLKNTRPMGPNQRVPYAGAAGDDLSSASISGMDALAPNVSAGRQTAGAAEDLSGFASPFERYAPSLSGIGAAADDIVDESGRVLAKAPKQTPIQTAPRSLNEPPVMEGRQFAASPDPADLPRMQMPNTRQRITQELDDLEDVTSRADREWQAANPAMPRAMRGGQEPLSLQVMDDVIEPQGLPSMGEVDDVIGNMANVPFSKAKGSPRLNRSADQSIEAIKAAKQHGIAGFHDLPELSAGELARMSANIKRFGGR